MPSAQNPRFGIFRSKRARDLAIKYNLDLNDKRAYMTSSKLVNYHDVFYIVDNLWLDYLNGHINPPADVSMEEYEVIHARLISQTDDPLERILGPNYLTI